MMNVPDIMVVDKQDKKLVVVDVESKVMITLGIRNTRSLRNTKC